MASSKPHRDMVIKAIAQSIVPVDTSPVELTQMIINIQFGNIIAFFYLDMPSFGSDHVEALHVTITTCSKEVPRVLVDNSSAMNVLPLKMLGVLGLDPSTLKPSGHIV